MIESNNMKHEQGFVFKRPALMSTRVHVISIFDVIHNFQSAISGGIRHLDEFYIKPVTEKAYPKINYKPAKKESKLNDFDVIEIGSAKMQFHYLIA